MTKQELITEVGSNFLKAKNKTARDAAATVALNGIDTNKPFVYAVVDSSTVVCLQPGNKSENELNEILEGARLLNSSLWYYYHPKKGVFRTTYLTVVQSIEEYIRRRNKK